MRLLRILIYTSEIDRQKESKRLCSRHPNKAKYQPT